MKVTVDTRHDSLEEALATVHAAFGSGTTEPAAAPVVEEAITSPSGLRSAKRASGRGKAAKQSAEPTAKPVLAKKSTKRTSKAGSVAKASVSGSAGKRAPAKKTSVRNGTKSTKSINPTSNVAPPGQADAIRAWARTQGMEVKQAGRLPAAVIQAYQELPDGA
jgi:hypothetical protein